MAHHCLFVNYGKQKGGRYRPNVGQRRKTPRSHRPIHEGALARATPARLKTQDLKLEGLPGDVSGKTCAHVARLLRRRTLTRQGLESTTSYRLTHVSPLPLVATSGLKMFAFSMICNKRIGQDRHGVFLLSKWASNSINSPFFLPRHHTSSVPCGTSHASSLSSVNRATMTLRSKAAIVRRIWTDFRRPWHCTEWQGNRICICR